MRGTLLLVVLLALLPSVTAQATGAGFGEVTVSLQRQSIDLDREKPQEVGSAVNATILCEPGYAPTPIVLAVRAASLRDENRTDTWQVTPSSVGLEFISKGQDRYEAHATPVWTINAVEGAPARSGRIQFDLFQTGSGMVTQTDCRLIYGSNWRFTNEPYIDVIMQEDEPIQAGTGEEPAAAPPPAFDPSEVVVEEGPITGQSRTPAQAFWSFFVVAAIPLVLLVRGRKLRP